MPSTTMSGNNNIEAHYIIHYINILDSNELVLIATVTSCTIILMVIIIGSVMFLYIRQKLRRRAKIVDISKLTTSAGVPQAKPSNQFVVKGNDDEVVYYINYPQNPSSNEGNNNTNETSTYM